MTDHVGARGSDGTGAGSHSESGTGRDLLTTLDRVADRADRETVSCTYQCHSGGTFGGEWRGVAVADLLAEADPQTTHLLAVATDGYCVPVPVVTALEAVVATERIGDAAGKAVGVDVADDPVGGNAADDDDEHSGLPRLVGEKLDSSETVRSLSRLVPVAFSADADPEPRYVDDDPVAAVLDGEVDSRHGGGDVEVVG